MDSKRLVISRLYHRLAFGPKPGEYQKALKAGVDKTRKALLTRPASDAGAEGVSAPALSDLGPFPTPNSPEVIPFATARRSQIMELTLWWLDLMVASNHGLQERMTWFWHGHWATSIQKVEYALPMYKQNNTLRTYSLGKFSEMVKAMLNDGALQFWLDGQVSTVKAPNENLGRELMELFVLGVNRYTEDDVKNISRTLTGYQVVRSSGNLLINQSRRDTKPVTILGTTATFTGDLVADFLVARDDCAQFIAERLWYRFISSTTQMADNFSARTAFAKRDIQSAVKAIATDRAFNDPNNSLVRSPVEWLVSSCRALEIMPSKVDQPSKLINHLEKLNQVPFAPPSVGGWPAGQAWLSSAAAQYRIAAASYLIGQSRLTAVKSANATNLISQSQDWLGIAQWSSRTQAALREVISDPEKFALIALCSPEYIVSA